MVGRRDVGYLKDYKIYQYIERERQQKLVRERGRERNKARAE